MTIIMSSSTGGNRSIVVVFGRPGAGKTTISNATLKMLKECNHDQCLLLDLDVCVPDWMRTNFSKGIYPTLTQRIEFASSACDYVDKEIEILRKSNHYNYENKALIIISFSFVNTDLRDVFRSRFDDAKWALVDVDDCIAQERIEKREGHFYKGAPPSNGKDINKSDNISKDIDNNEWEFAPVNFEHVILNGLLSVDINANIIIQMLTQIS